MRKIPALFSLQEALRFHLDQTLESIMVSEMYDIRPVGFVSNVEYNLLDKKNQHSPQEKKEKKKQHHRPKRNKKEKNDEKKAKEQKEKEQKDLIQVKDRVFETDTEFETDFDFNSESELIQESERDTETDGEMILRSIQVQEVKLEFELLITEEQESQLGLDSSDYEVAVTGSLPILGLSSLSQKNAVENN